MLAPGREDQGGQTRRAFSEARESKPEIQAARRQHHHNRLAGKKRRKTWHERARLCATTGVTQTGARRGHQATGDKGARSSEPAKTIIAIIVSCSYTQMSK